MKQTNNNICKFCGKEKKLIKAHIIPKSFYIGENYVLKDLTSGETKRRPCGFYDGDILCSDCDNHIFGKYDEYATKIFLKEYANHIEHQNKDYILYHLKKNEFSYDYIRAFIISVLWRASVSNIKECEDVYLGEKYENIAKYIIKNKEGYADLFKMQFYRIPKGKIGSDVVYILRMRIDNEISYKLCMANYVITITTNGNRLLDETKVIQQQSFNTDNLYIVESKEIYELELNSLKRSVTIFEKNKKTE